jgi:methionyl-tRNA formyltransferase
MKPKILFIGTPEFAIPSLKILINNDYHILGVVTQPDRPKGRGKKHVSPPVKVVAEQYNLKVFQPESVRDKEFLDTFSAISPDMVVLTAFGQILPREIIEFPPMGCLNIHPSLLPKYRGAAPINRALINGEEKTGVTIMLMDEGVDSGDIILQEETDIDSEEIFDDLHSRLAQIGAGLLLKAVEGVTNGTITRTPQDSSLATFAPRLTRETGHINWENSVRDIINLIKGLSSSPGAYSFLREKKLKILFAVSGKMKTSGEKEPGKLGKLMESGLQVTAADGHVYIQEVQLEGRKRMFIDDFLRGHQIFSDDVLE